MGPRLSAPSGEQVLPQWQAQQCVWTGLTADNGLQAPHPHSQPWACWCIWKVFTEHLLVPGVAPGTG